jgi:iron complex transport system permease protein
VLGISGGASVGATLAVLVVGGYGPNLVLSQREVSSSLAWIPACAFVGALAVGALVQRLATRAGAVSIPALLLVGIAVNTFVGGVFQWLQSAFLGDWEVSRSILAWTFGTLEGRRGWHAATVWTGVAIAAAVIPLVAWELDLMQAGLEDAEALGVDTVRVRWIALAGASVGAAAAVAVAGQIGFVGLVVPHLVRQLSGVSHKTLLGLSALFGAVFLLGLDLAQTVFLGGTALAPGVLMSLIGGPFFVWLVWLRRREIATW